MTINQLFKSLTLVTLLSGTCLATVDNVGDHNIGAGAGFITGYGLSYRQWLGRFGFQVTTAPYYNKDNYGSHTVLSLGATALAKIKEARYVNLIAYAGPHYFYRSESYNSGIPTENLFFGIGPGLDFHFLNISFNLMGGYLAEFEFARHRFGTMFSGECALYYSF